MKLFRHIFFSLVGTRTYFSKGNLRDLDIAVTNSEKEHACQICIAIEGTMSLWDLLRGKSCRQRAWEIFSLERMWDTEQNVGLLIFVSLAEKNIEIVADRAIAAKIADSELELFCSELEKHFLKKNFADGISNLLLSLGKKLSEHFPRATTSQDEIPQRVTVY